MEEAADGEGSSSPRPHVSANKKKKKHVIIAAPNPGNVISDSWEAVNAKLQYEKHLQDSGNNSPVPSGGTRLNPMVINDSVQRNEFYRNSNSNSSNNIGASSSNSPKVTMASGGKIADLQTNFGEILHSAPAAFSPQFTRKGYRTAGPGLSKTLSNCSADDEGEGGTAGGNGGTSPEKPPKTVFIKPLGGKLQIY